MTATANGVSTPASFSLSNTPGAANSISVTSGAGQSATVNTPFASALVATVTDQYGNPLSGVSVTFAAPGSAASATFPNGATATTGSNGQASDAVKANTIAGSYSVTATASGVGTPASFSLSNSAGTANSIVMTLGSGQSATVNTSFASVLAATVLDQYGNPVPGISVTFAAPGSGASATFPGGATATTGGNGQASDAVKANTIAGSYSVTASFNGVSTPAAFSLTNTVGTASSIVVASGANQGATVNTSFTSALTATVLDLYGNPVSGVSVTFTAPSSGASGIFTNSSAGISGTTNSSGQLSETFTANTVAGSYNVTASAGGVGAPTSFSLSNIAAAATHFVVNAATTANVGVASNFTVAAKDQYNNTSTIYTGIVSFSSTDTHADLPGSTTLINGAGAFSATFTTPGPQTLTATDEANSLVTGVSGTITVSSTGLPFSDNFTTFPNNQLTTNWTTQTGSFQVTSGAARGIDVLNVATVVGVSAANVVVQANVIVAAGQYAGLVAHYSGPGNQNMYWAGLVNTGGGVVAEIWRNDNGWNELSNQIISSTGTATLRFELAGSSLKLFVNDILATFANDTALTSGTVGMRDSAGGIVGSFNASDLLLTNPSLPFTDTFTTTTRNQLGSNWLNQTGNMQAGSGASAGVANLNLATVNGINSADVTVQADVIVPAGDYAGVTARYSGTGDANMYWAGLINYGPGKEVAGIYRIVNSGWTALATQTVSSLGTDALSFETAGSSLRLFVNGALTAFANDGVLTTGSVGMLDGGGAIMSNFNAAATPLTNAALPFSDTFSSAVNGQLSSYWLNQVGNMQVASGASAGVANLNLATVNGINSADVTVQADVIVPAGDYAGVTARYSGTGDANMYWAGLINYGPGNKVAAIYRIVNSGWTALATQTVSSLGTDALSFETAGSSLRLFVNGALTAFANDGVLTSGSVGMLDGGGAVMSNFNAAATPLTNAALSFSDTFSSAVNGQLSSYWLNQVGNMQVASGTSAGVANLNLATVNGINSADVTVQADVTVPAGDYAGVTARYSGTGDANMYWAGLINYGPGNEVAAIYRIVKGGWTALATQTVSSLGTDALSFETASTSLELFVNGAMAVFANDGVLTSGSVGMLDGGGAVMSNFNASDPTPTNASLPFSDNFSMTANKQLSSYWLNQSGNFEVAPGVARGFGSVNVATINGVNAADVTVQAAVTVGAGQYAGLVARYSGTGDQNMYWAGLVYTDAGVEAEIWRNVNGVWAQLAGTSIGSTSAALTFEVTGPSLKLLVNGVLTTFTDDTTLTSGTVGMRAGMGGVVSSFQAR